MSNEIEGNRVLLLGYGREGQSTHRFLLSHLPNLTIGVADRKVIDLVAGGSAAEVFSGPNYLDAVPLFDTIVHSPGISMQESTIATKLSSRQKVTSATNLFFEHFPGRSICVTGTKGKSTTSSLIAHILKAALPEVTLAGNIGIPMLDQLLGASKDSTYVLELSSFQLEDFHFAPDIAVLLDIVPEHLDHHLNFEQYVAAKARIAAQQLPTSTLVYNHELELPTSIAARSIARKAPFSSAFSPQSFCWIDNGDVVIRVANQPQPILKVSELPVRGPGNAQNVLAAITVGMVLGLTPEVIGAAVRSFAPLEHRLEVVGNFKGITFINDSLSTIPEALHNALLAYPGQIDTVIAGGFDRGLDYTLTGKAIAASMVKNLILFPTTGDKIWEASVKAGSTGIARLDVSSMQEAVTQAYRVTAQGKICLLSPASSSFNLFRDYKDRGESFKSFILMANENAH